jgi:hypothetical protein
MSVRPLGCSSCMAAAWTGESVFNIDCMRVASLGAIRAMTRGSAGIA